MNTRKQLPVNDIPMNVIVNTKDADVLEAINAYKRRGMFRDIDTDLFDLYNDDEY